MPNKMLNVKRNVLLVTAALSLLACENVYWRWPKANFNRQKWQETSEGARYIYVKSLIDSEMLIGLDKAGVARMLGVPSFEDASGNYETYVVRSDGGTIYMLDIRFSNDPKRKLVTEVFVRSD